MVIETKSNFFNLIKTFQLIHIIGSFTVILISSSQISFYFFFMRKTYSKRYINSMYLYNVLT